MSAPANDIRLYLNTLETSPVPRGYLVYVNKVPDTSKGLNCVVLTDAAGAGDQSNPTVNLVDRTVQVYVRNKSAAESQNVIEAIRSAIDGAVPNIVASGSGDKIIAIQCSIPLNLGYDETKKYHGWAMDLELMMTLAGGLKLRV